MPSHAATRILQSTVAYQRLGDTRPLHDLTEAMMAADPKVGPQLAEYWFQLGRWERDVDIMKKAIEVMPPEGMAVDSARFPRAWCEAMAAKTYGEVSIAHTKLLEARNEVAETVRQQPNFPVMLSVLGVIDANLGRKDLAISEGRQAVDALPLSKDSINGAHAINYLAVIYAWTGERDLAIQELQLASSIPSDVSYGYLLLDPFWDPLRGDARFEKILASLAPK
jgi:tetratricopeptide (TPR) repeat protein